MIYEDKVLSPFVNQEETPEGGEEASTEDTEGGEGDA